MLGQLHADVTVREIVDLLRSEGVVADEPSAELASSSDIFTHVSVPMQAKAGALSWLSARACERDPGLGVHFEGTLLLASKGVLGKRVVRCSDPKLAFVLATELCFPEFDAEWVDTSGGAGRPASVGSNVRLGSGVCCGADVRIGDDVSIGPNTCLQYATIGDDVSIGANCTVGGPGFGFVWHATRGWLRFPHVGRVIIERGVIVGNNTCIDRGALGDTIVRQGARIDNQVHVAHNVDLGRDTLVIANAMIAGSVTVGPKAWIAPSAAILNQLSIGSGSVVGLGAVVIDSVADGATVVGNPAKELVRHGKP
jgi:acetyltransferase-like isoleucine patch superfamily enzyme